MKEIFKSVIVLFFVSVVCCLPCFAVEVSCKDFFQNKNLELEYSESTKDVESLIKNFCSVSFDYGCQYDEIYSFEADQSIFLSILCNSIGVDVGDNGILDLLKKKNFKDFGIIELSSDGKIDKCDVSDKGVNLNDCDLLGNLSVIFDGIINDYFNIRQASNFGIISLDSGINEKEISNNYIKNHFPGATVQDWWQDGICGTSYYKNTCKFLNKYVNQTRNLLVNTSIVDVANLSGDQDSCISDFSNNMLYCGLLGEQNRPFQSLLNVIYNEYFWYSLFMSYFEYYYLTFDENLLDVPGSLQALSGVLNGSQNLDSVDKMDTSIYLQKVYNAQTQVKMSKNSISEAMLSLLDVDYALAVHVGFLMYQEDANLFMKNLPKIYTPFRTLYDKLRNVQDANS